jgi:transmembrane sensor
MSAPIDQIAQDAARDEAARRWLVRLASGEMTEAEMTACHAWLADPQNRRSFERERALWRQLETVRQAFDAPQAEIVALRPSPVRSRPRLRRVVIAGAIAASLLLVVFAGPLKTALQADYTTAAGAQRTVSLPDGSTALLNTDSAIALHYTVGERRIEVLRGEAFFEVRPDAERPFRVMTRDGVAQAIGTAFAVRSDMPAVSVTVSHGVVAVSAPTSADGPTVIARQGQRVTYGPDAAPVLQPAVVDAEAALAWRRGRVVIEGLPLTDAVAELNRYRPGRILLLGETARRQPVSLVFALDQIDNALAGLAASQGLILTALPGGIVLLR